jgi:hypothetical protein
VSLLEMDALDVRYGDFQALFGVDMRLTEGSALALFAARRPDRLAWPLERIYEAFPGIAARRHQQAATLSGGEQQAVAIARALAANPRMLLLDEMSLGLAPRVVEELYRTLALLRAEGDPRTRRAGSGPGAGRERRGRMPARGSGRPGRTGGGDQSSRRGVRLLWSHLGTPVMTWLNAAPGSPTAASSSCRTHSISVTYVDGETGAWPRKPAMAPVHTRTTRGTVQVTVPMG